MTLKDDLLPLVDELRGIAGELGFRPYQVWVRKTIYAGQRGGLGAKSAEDTRLLVGEQDPKVRLVRSQDVVAGSAELLSAEFEIGPLTPEFGTGGVSNDTISPEKDGTPRAVTYVLKGPGLPESGLLCQKLSDQLDRPLRMMVRVKGSGRAA